MADPDLIEEWRVVEEVPDYEVSNLGRVRRGTARANRSGKQPTGGILKPWLDTDGYRYVTLPTASGTKRRCRISILVCRAFHGPRPMPAPPAKRYEAAHDDGDQTNDTAANLAWKTSIENHADKIRRGTTSRGERNRMAILTEEQAREIKRLILAGEMNQLQIGKLFNISNTTVSKIKLGQAWKHV